MEKTGTAIQTTPEHTVEVDAQWEKKIESYKGTAGEVYLTLEKKLRDLQSEMRTSTESNKTAIERQHDEVVQMKTLLDLDTQIRTMNQEKQVAIGFDSLSVAQQKHYRETLKENTLREITLGALNTQIDQIIGESTRDNSPSGLKRRVAAQKVKSMINQLQAA